MNASVNIAQHLLESDEDVDPKAYMMSLRRKRDVVIELVRRFSVRHAWEFTTQSERLNVTYPKEIDFSHLLCRHGVAPETVAGISSGSKNYRMSYWWQPGALDQLVNPQSMEEPERPQ
jgi:hypothetical protein